MELFLNALVRERATKVKIAVRSLALTPLSMHGRNNNNGNVQTNPANGLQRLYQVHHVENSDVRNSRQDIACTGIMFLVGGDGSVRAAWRA